LPYRFAGTDSGEAVEVLLVTSFRSHRWIIPKGDIDDGMAPHLAAEKEAFEEGGVQGRIGQKSIGCFSSRKMQNGAAIPMRVDVFPLEVREELRRWPEMDIRERRWLTVEEAASAVEEPELQAIIASFRP
jgi:8-oxo-dGTP pyrophosphatase MutT (NUDIX family)